MDIGDGASLELVDMFCYLGDMLIVDGDADAAVEARVRKGRDIRSCVYCWDLSIGKSCPVSNLDLRSLSCGRDTHE